MPEKLVERLHRHNWRRGVWYGGKCVRLAHNRVKLSL